LGRFCYSFWMIRLSMPNSCSIMYILSWIFSHRWMNMFMMSSGFILLQVDWRARMVLSTGIQMPRKCF
jgi:hypothetical protein